MTTLGILQIAVYFLILTALTKPLGAYMARVFQGERTILQPVLRPLEKLVYSLGGVKENVEQRWTGYTASLLAFSLVCFLFTYFIQRLQGILPFNPQGFIGAQTTPDLSFNTAVSFMTNTGWQAYGGESTMSYFVQMAALAVQNFVSAAAGIAVAIALVRGFARQQTNSIGNFWVDLVRATLYILLPLSLMGALFFCSQGVIQNFRPYQQVTTLQGTATQTIPGGPAASQIAIKQLGSNGGGFFNANSAHPFENPTPLSNFIEMLFMLLIPAGLTYTFGVMAGDTRQGWTLFAAMSVLFLAGAFVCYRAEQAGNPILAQIGIETQPAGDQPGGNMEGKEVRNGIASSALWAAATAAAGNGSVNSMHGSFTPIGGLIPLFFIQTRVVFGGAGSGLSGILLFAILAVSIAGRLVGRTPEYLGKKIEGTEVRMALLALIGCTAALLAFTGISSGLNDGNPHGFSEILYAYSSAVGNNGSAFAGIAANTPWYNLTIGLAMLIGRFLNIIPMLAAAGNLAAKKRTPATAGTLPTHGPLFAGVLLAAIIIVGAIAYFPALWLGPIAEHFRMLEGRLF